MRRWPFTFTLIFRSGYRTTQTTVRVPDEPPALFASTSFTHSFIRPPSMTVSFLSFLLSCLPLLPVSLRSKQVSFSLDVRVFVPFNCRPLGYTATIERHPTMTIIRCSDGCNLCLGTKEEQFFENSSELKSSVAAWHRQAIFRLTGSILKQVNIWWFSFLPCNVMFRCMCIS